MRFPVTGEGSRLPVALALVASLAAATVASIPLPVSGGAPAVGAKAPDFTLPDANGSPVTLSRLFAPERAGNHGTWVLLVFYRGYW
ncbi:MAG: hypothetical protein WEB59_06340 [Thermoanaerobaculia bacterium]